MPSGVLSSSGSNGKRRLALFAASLAKRPSCSVSSFLRDLFTVLSGEPWPKINLGMLTEIVPFSTVRSLIYSTHRREGTKPTASETESAALLPP